MREKSTSREYSAGEKKGAEGMSATSKAATLRMDTEMSVKGDKERNAQTARNLHEVFGKMDISEEDQHISLMLQEQSPIILKYLKGTTKGGEGGDIYNDMAPGIAMLGFEMARSGFGRDEIDSGDKDLNKKLSDRSEKRYKAAFSVFNLLLNKMYPEGTSRETALLQQLSRPIGNAKGPDFDFIKDRLGRLYDEGLPDDNRGINQYQGKVDVMIRIVGDSMGSFAEMIYEYGIKGEITNEESENYRSDMLTMAMALKELHRLRVASVEHKYGSKIYNQMSPRNLRGIENSEKRAEDIFATKQVEAESETSFDQELQIFDSAVLSLKPEQIRNELKRLAKLDLGEDEDLQFATDDASIFLKNIKKYQTQLKFLRKKVKRGEGIDPDKKAIILQGLERVAKSLLNDMPAAIDQIQDPEVKQALQLMENAATALAKERFPDAYQRKIEF